MNKGFVFLASYYEALRPIPDVERLALLDAILDFAFEGIEPQNLSPLLKGYFILLRPNIESGLRRYNAAVSNGKTGGRPPKNTTETQQKPSKNPSGTQREPGRKLDKDKDDEIEFENELEVVSAAAPRPTHTPPETNFGPELQAAFDRWLDYKKERRETYKPTGLSALVTQIQRNAAQYGEKAVAELIESCMANGWRGIIWDKLQPGKTETGRSGNIFAQIAREEGLI